MRLIRRLRAIANHPLNRSNRLAAIGHLIRWQAGSRMLPGTAVVPFTQNTRLVVRRGMTGATGNIYCGLHDFEDMCFLLHFLRSADTFVDVGANVGTYTVLASGEARARSICIEPIPQAFQHLLDNIYLNRLNDLVDARNIGIGNKNGVAHFTCDEDTTNHVVENGHDETAAVEVEIRTLDEVLRSESASLIKVDVEGFERQVIEGARDVLYSESLCAVLIEMNGSGRRYGHDDETIHEQMTQAGFRPHQYDPFSRKLTAISVKDRSGRNALYVRNERKVAERLASAIQIAMPRHSI